TRAAHGAAGPGRRAPAVRLGALALVAAVAVGAWSIRRGSEIGVATAVPTPQALPTPASAPVDPATWQVPGMPMTERLERIRLAIQAYPMGNRYANADRARWLLASGVPEDPSERRQYEIRVAFNLLYAGRTAEAVERMRVIEEGLSAARSPNPRALAEVRALLAIAWLRLGEQTNCITRHTADSCLLPLRGSGIHVDQQGSAQAVEVLERMLAADPGDLVARWMLNLAHMTLGTYPDAVPPEHLIPESTFASEVDLGRFEDVAPSLGLDAVSLSGGSVLDDFDNDGDLDAVFSSFGFNEPLRFFRNEGDGTFTDRSSAAGLDGLFGGLHVVQTDYDNDGFLDLFVPRGSWLGEEGLHPNSLLRNNGDGTFTDVTEAAGLLTFHPTQVAAWADFDGDGWLDLFVGNESIPADVIPAALGQEDTSKRPTHPSELYRNNHDGTFTRQDADVAYIKGAVWGDYDNDGRPDLYVSRLGGANGLYHNDGPDAEGRWRFTDVGVEAGVTEPRFSFSAWFFDYDNDGWEDIGAADYGQPAMGRTAELIAGYLGLPTEGDHPHVYRNNRDGTFTDASASLGLTRPTFTMGSNFGDVDNDGWLDLYLATGDPQFESLYPNRLYRNDAGVRFQEATSAAGVGHIQKGHGVAFGDVDNDGDQDIWLNQGGAYAGDGYQKVLFLNPGHANRWLTLQLQGTRANRAAIGARVKVTFDEAAGPRDIHATVGTGSSFGANSLRLELGLGAATAIRAVTVRWPGSGLVETYTGLSVDRAYRLVEGTGVPEAIALRRVPIAAP
ncbi:hypothetical protein DCC79_04425, partial [bacterium]